jgi:hypothetical protein
MTIKVGDLVAFFYAYCYGVGAVTSIKNNILTVKLCDGKVHDANQCGRLPYSMDEEICYIKQAVKLKSIQTQNNGNILITGENKGEFERKNPLEKGDIVACYYGHHKICGEVKWRLGSSPDNVRVNVVGPERDILPHWRQCEKLKGLLKWKVKAQILLKKLVKNMSMAFKKGG